MSSSQDAFPIRLYSRFRRLSERIRETGRILGGYPHRWDRAKTSLLSFSNKLQSFSKDVFKTIENQRGRHVERPSPEGSAGWRLLVRDYPAATGGAPQ